MKYKTDFKKYWKSEVDKYKSISVEIKRPERADLVKRLDVFNVHARFNLVEPTNASGAKFTTNASGATWWPKLKLIQITSTLGQT